MPMIVKTSEKAPGVEIPPVVRAQGPDSIMAFVKAKKPDVACLVGIPFASPAAEKTAKDAGADAMDFGHRKPEGATGFSVDEVRDILGIPEPEKKPAEGGES